MDKNKAIELYRLARKLTEESLGMPATAEQVEQVLISAAAITSPKTKEAAPKAAEQAEPVVAKAYARKPNGGKAHKKVHKPFRSRTQISWDVHQGWFDTILNGEINMIPYSVIEAKIPFKRFGKENLRHRFWKEGRNRGYDSISVTFDDKSKYCMVASEKHSVPFGYDASVSN